MKDLKKEEDKIRIKILCSALIVPFHVLPITIFHKFFFQVNKIRKKEKSDIIDTLID